MISQDRGSADVPQKAWGQCQNSSRDTSASSTVPAGKRDVQVFDDALPGFGVRKFESGRASYFVKFNVGKQQRRLTLGAVVPGNLAEMRRKASTILSKARLGQDAVAEKRHAAGRRSGALGALVGKYLDDREPRLRPRYFVEIKRQLSAIGSRYTRSLSRVSGVKRSSASSTRSPLRKEKPRPTGLVWH